MIKDILIDLLVENPYFGYLAGKVQFTEDPSIKTTQTVFHNDVQLCYNPDWLSGLSDSHRRGAIVHELMHLAILHFFRREGRDPELWHMACDLAVSSLMDDDEIHEDILTTYKLYLDAYVHLPSGQSAEYYYEQLKDNEVSVPHNYQSSALAEPDMSDLNIQAFIDELAHVQAASQTENILSEDLGTQTDKALGNHKLHWRSLLKKFLTGQGRVEKHRSYKRSSRRFENYPGSKRSIGVRALIAVDESASISNDDIQGFHQELLRINGINHAHITAVRFDTTCSEPMPLLQFVTESKRTKRGGTDFRPIFELADRLKMPLVVVFTDGMGEAPYKVNQKVLWVLTGSGRAPADYGIAVRYTEDYHELPNRVRTADSHQTLLREGIIEAGEPLPSAHGA